jgi:hypothetical protein
MHGFSRSVWLLLVLIIIALPVWPCPMGPPGWTAQATIDQQATQQVVIERILASAVIAAWPPTPSVQIVRSWTVRTGATQPYSEKVRRVDRERKWPLRMFRPRKTCPPS